MLRDHALQPPNVGDPPGKKKSHASLHFPRHAKMSEDEIVSLSGKMMLTFRNRKSIRSKRIHRVRTSRVIQRQLSRKRSQLGKQVCSTCD